MVDPARQPYTFPEALDPYDWQSETADEWFAHGATPPHDEIAQAVTGAGKTVMMLKQAGDRTGQEACRPGQRRRTAR